MSKKSIFRVELNPGDKEEARDLREHSLFLAGFSLVSLGILLSFDIEQVRFFLHPNIGVRIHQYLFICLILFATCSEVLRRIKHYYDYIIADIFYILGMLMLYSILSTIIFNMRPSLFIKAFTLILLGYMIYNLIHDLFSILQSAKNKSHQLNRE
jgi:hypothetical protein